ncbi:DUF6339 family protein [Sphaerimonospora mesophila]|uniref:DUF6339 family protein n=1 Tax=Sphaerimonospora mesophila TaxID=37483 RepID=UPI0009FA77F6
MNNIPEWLACLPDAAAAKFLTTAVLEQREPLPFAAIDRASLPTRWAVEPVRQLVDEALKRFESESRTAADAWLAPVLHATLRLTRQEAADSRLWNHLALRVAPDYVFRRHPGRQPARAVNRGRFSGPFYSQAFARLWWAAELFRDGPDYGPVVIACGNQDVLNTVLRLEVILHRPTAQAILRLLSSGIVRTGREVNALAQAVNTAGSTLAYEALAPDVQLDTDSYWDWIENLTDVLVPYDSLPDGPDDGHVPARSVETLTEIFKQLFMEAPVRGRAESDQRAIA